MKVRAGYRTTELGVIPQEWETKKLEDACLVLDSRRKPVKSEDRENMKGDIPYYGASGIIDWVNDYIFDEDLILLAEDGENIKTRNLPLAFTVSGKCWVNNHAHVFKAIDGNSNDYIAYALENKDYSSFVIGSAQPKLNQAECRKFLLAIPPLLEQQRIAEILSSNDALITKTDELIEKTKEVKQGLMQELFTKGIGHTEFRDSELGSIPNEWEIKTLEEVCTILDGKRKPVKSEDRENMKGDIPYYGASGIIDWVNNYIFDDELILLGEDGENIKSRNLPLAFRVSGKCWVNNHAHVFKISDEQRNNVDYVTYALENKDYSVFVIGSAQPKLNQAVCRKLLLAIPAIDEQNKIASILVNIDNKIEALKKRKQQLKEIKQGLMQDLLTGRIRVNLN